MDFQCFLHLCLLRVNLLFFSHEFFRMFCFELFHFVDSDPYLPRHHLPFIGVALSTDRPLLLQHSILPFLLLALATRLLLL